MAPSFVSTSRRTFACGLLNFFLLTVAACGSSGSGSLALSPVGSILDSTRSESETASTQLLTGTVQDGQVTFTRPIPANYAAAWRLDIATTQALPPQLDIDGSLFSQYEDPPVDGTVSYAVTLESAFNWMESVQTVAIPAPDGSLVSLQPLQARESTALIYQSNPTLVTIEDVAVALAALQNLPSPTAQEIADDASALLGSPGQITVESLDPVPTLTNLDYVRQESALTLIDVAVILSTIQSSSRTRSDIASRTNTLLDSPNAVEASDIRLIPGTTLPGPVVEFDTEVDAFAGFIQISAFVPRSRPLPDSFTIGTSTFVKTSLELYPGFITYTADAPSGFLNVQFQELQLSSLANSDCVIVHSTPLDPVVPDNQLAVSFACGADFDF